MPNRLLLRPLCLVFSLAIAFLVAWQRPSDARPNYKACWEEVYKDVVKKIGKDGKVTCAVCHVGDDKKHLNHYGKAIAEELGEKAVKDKEKIIAAIKAVAKRKCKSGVWGERLEKGLVPCDCGDQDHDSYIERQLHRVR